MSKIISYKNYLAGSMLYGFTRSFIYDNNKNELYTSQIMIGLFTGIMQPFYMNPLSMYEDMCNIERYYRGLPINKNSKYIF